VLVFLIAACVSSSSALRCYDCIYPDEPACKDSKNLHEETCPEPSAAENLLNIKAVCWKNIRNIEGSKEITRSCTKQGGNYNPCAITGRITEHCSVCDDDLCNGSSNLLIKFWTMLVPIALAIFMTLY